MFFFLLSLANTEILSRSDVQVVEANKTERRKAGTTCLVCNLSFSGFAALKEHIHNDHMQKDSTCNFSGQLISTPSELPTHIADVRPAEKTFKCDDCDVVYKSVQGLNYHKCKIHASSSLYQCKQCDRKFPSKNNYENHVKAIHEGVTYTCDVCGKVCRYSGDLTVHKKVHDPDYQPPKCEICDKTFNFASAKLYHMNRVHGNIKNTYVCEVCGLSVTSSTSLRDHMMRHTGEKPISCDFCGKSFIRQQSLMVHLRVHTREKPHLCKVCGKSFSQRSSLTTHTRAVHTKEKLHECGVCRKGFATKSCLKIHGKSHGIVTNEEIDEETVNYFLKN